MKLYLENKNENFIPANLDILIKAREELFHNKNYKYAFLDAFIFIESTLSNAIKDEKKNRGVSNKKIKNYEKDIGIGYQSNIEYQLLFPELYLQDKSIVTKMNQVRKIRNEIVHEGIDVTEENALLCIEVADKFYKLFQGKRNATNNV